MNKYHQILSKVLDEGRHQSNRKGDIIYLINEQLSLTPSDLLDIFESHGIARKKLRSELSLFAERREADGEVSRGGHQLVGLLRPGTGQLLPHLL